MPIIKSEESNLHNFDTKILKDTENLMHLKLSIERILEREVFMPQILKVKDFIKMLNKYMEPVPPLL